MVAVHDDREVMSATSVVDLERPLAGPLPAADLRLEHVVGLAQPTEAVDLRRAAGSSASPPLSLPFPPDAAADATRGRARTLRPALLLGWGPAATLPLPHPLHACFAPP